MDSPMNQGSTCGQAPMSPQTPTDSNAYQVNVNRTKTKKWVEAKVHSYDGDDWGADEYEDDQLEPMLAPPVPKPATHAPRSRESSLSSLQTQPSIVSPAPSGHLRDRRSPDRMVPNVSSTRAPGKEDQTLSHPTINLTHGAKDTHLQPDVTPPSEQPAATRHNDADPVVRPSDILGRTEEESGKEAKSSDMSAPKSISKTAHLRSDSMGKDENFNAASRPESIEQDDEDAGDVRRLSTSPKLPDVARMSAFGADLFSPGGNNLFPNKLVVENARGDSLHSSSNEPEVMPSSYNNENVAATDGRPLVAKPMDMAKDAVKRRTSEIEPGTAGVVSPAPAPQTITKNTAVKSGTPILAPESSNSLLKDNVPDLHPDSDIQTIAPLRTPSPRAPARSAPGNSLSETEAIPSQKDLRTEQAKSGHEVSTALGSITRQATFDTVASSPVKDNDMLSDEILKSLSPPATPARSFNRQPSSQGSQSSGHTGPIDSNYTLKGHDDCWEGTETNTKSFDTLANMPSIPDIPDKKDASTSQSITSPTEQPTESLVSPQSSTLRRQFSWEAEEQVVPAQAQAQHQSALPAASSTAPAVNSVEGSHQSLTAVDDQSMDGSEDSAVQTSRAVGVSPQVSTGSSQPPVPPKTVLEAPSPVTPASDTNPTSSRAFNRLSLADEKALAHADSHPVSSTSPHENHPALVEQHSPSPVSWSPTSQQPQPQIMNFREIMNLGSSEERIAKYKQLREILATTDSGLENWLVHLRAEHPDMGLNGALFSAQGSQQVAPWSNAPIQAGSNNPLSHQPYYQQYLNASSPNTAASPTSRSRLAGLPIPSHPAGSAFGHSGNQIGNKSKELMHSAGKMGKGLLSKGRSKLRGTGDKGEAVPPSDEPKVTKADRRMSWGMGLGLGRGLGLGFKSMSRGDPEREAPQQAEVSAPPSAQLPIAAPLSPLNPAARSEDMPEWRSSAPDASSAQSVTVTALQHAAPPSQSRSGHPSRATAGLRRLEIPHSASLVFTASQSAPLPSLSYSQNGRAPGHDTWDVNVSANKQVDSDWAMVTRDRRGQHQAPEPALPSTMESKREKAPPSGLVPEDSGIGLSGRDLQPSEEPKRTSSFIGLPPIRRGSTFALGSKTRARRAAARFPIDDDDEDEHEHERAAQANVDDMVPGTATSLQNPPHPSYSSQEPTILAAADIRGRDAMAPTTFTEEGKDAVLVSHSEAAPDSPPRDAGRPGHQPGPPEVQSGIHNGQDVRVPVTQMQGPQQVLHPSQRLPISGPWKLEESKLTEPLNPVSRNRSGTRSSPPQVMYGFDKETGLTSSDFSAEPQSRQHANQPRPQAQSQQQQQQQHVQHAVQHHAQNTVAPPPLRQRSDVPPSSAQRWPELFAHPAYQRSRWSARNGPQPADHAPYQSWLASTETILPRSRGNEFSIAGVGPPDEELGRGNGNPGLFQDLGLRIARATSRERRASTDPQGSAAPEVRGEEASEFSVLPGSEQQDQKGRRRPSFLFDLSRRRSVDQEPKHHGGTGREPENLQESRPTSTPRAAKRHSMFGSGLGGRLVPSGLAGSPSSGLNLARDQPTTAQTFNETRNTTPRKNRFPGLTKVPKALIRNKHEDRPVSSERLSGPLEPPPPATLFQRLGRPGTSSSFATGSQHHATDGHSERRGRRSSVSDFISGMLGKRSISKTGQGDPVDPWQPSRQQQSNLQPRFTDDAVQRRPESGRHQLPLVQNAHGSLPSSTPSIRSDMRRPTPSRDIESSIRPVQVPQPSPLGLAARKEVQPASLNHGSHPATQLGKPQQRPEPQTQESISEHTSTRQLTLGKDENFDDRIVITGQSNTPADGESIRPSTVSPDLSITSDWTATEGLTEYQVHDDGTRNPMSNVTGGQGAAAVPADSQTSKSLNPEPDDEALLPGPLFSRRPFPPPKEQAFVKNVADPAGNQQFGIRRQPAIPQFYNGPRPPQDMQHWQQPQGGIAGSSNNPKQAGSMDQQHPLQQQDPGQPACPPHQAPASQQAKESTGFQWKGLTKRVSGQMSGLGQRGPRKTKAREKEKSGSSNKILGAFNKRDSEQSDARIVAPMQMGAYNHSTFQGPTVQQPHHQPAYRQNASYHGHPGQRGLSGKPPGQTEPEPRYERVPIPRGYSAVHGEGVTVPTAYNLGRRHPGPQLHHLTAQQDFGAPPHEQISSPASQLSFPRQDSVSSFGLVASPSSLKASTSISQNLHDKTNVPPPPPGSSDVSRARQQHHDGDDTYDATPGRNKSESSETRALGLSAKPKRKRVLESTVEQAAEREDDTRPAAQEEKICCDADYLPQMSATSYPGQEWNPYEDPDYVDHS